MSENIADRVAKAIHSSKFDEDEIASKVGKSQSTVNRWGNKKTTNYPKSTLKKIADATQVRYEWLRYGDGPMTEKEKIEESNPDYLSDEVSQIVQLLNSGKVGKPSQIVSQRVTVLYLICT